MFFRGYSGIKNYEISSDKEILNELLGSINRLQQEQKKILIVGTLFKNIKDKLKVKENCICIPKIHKYIEKVLIDNGYNLENIKTNEQLEEYYEWVLPSAGIDFYTNIDEKEKFDTIIIKKNDTIKERWILCISKMLKSRGKVIELDN